MASNWIDEKCDGLKSLAGQRFGHLTAAETKMLRAAITGNCAWCGPSEKDDDPHNDPSSTEEWATERETRAELLRWICVDKQAESSVDGRGIRLHGAKVSGELDLSFVSLRFPLVLNHCRLNGDVDLRSARLHLLSLSGSFAKRINGDGLKVDGSVFLNDGFIACDGVVLADVEIDGSLDCGGGIFRTSPRKDLENDRTAIDAENAKVRSNVFLRHGFEAEGVVILGGAQIGGSLDCCGGIFKSPTPPDVQESGTALDVQNARVNGDVFLRDGFQADGEVNLMGIQIDGDLDCDGGRFQEVSAGRATIRHNLFWRNLDGLENTTLDLRAASVGSLADDQNSWPKPGKFLPDGFTYGRIAFDPKDSNSRMDWLSRAKSFKPQPYRQLAKVLCEEGDDDGARDVLFEMEKWKQRDGSRGLRAQLWDWVLRWTLGYGLYPRRALWALLLLLILPGWGIYRSGYSAGLMTPTNKDAYAEFEHNHQMPEHYPHFYASVYSTEQCFPLVNLGQKEFWIPDPNRQGYATFLRAFRWVQIVFGWALATLFVAGVTGIARKD